MDNTMKPDPLWLIVVNIVIESDVIPINIQSETT